MWTSAADLPAAVAEAAQELLRDGGTVGIVAPDTWLEHVAAALGEQAISEEIHAGVNVLTPLQAKGLEFDAVLFVEPADMVLHAPGGGYGALYTALTRSTRSLSVVHSKPLPAGLDRMGPASDGGGAERLDNPAR